MTRVPRPGLSVPILIAVGDVDLEVTIVDISTMAGRLSFLVGETGVARGLLTLMREVSVMKGREQKFNGRQI